MRGPALTTEEIRDYQRRAAERDAKARAEVERERRS
jgi:hypothetical protein